MYRQDVLGAEPLEHEPGLLGRGVVRNPGVIGSDWQYCEIDVYPMSQPGQHIGIGGVAGEQHRVPPLLQQISTVAAVTISDHPGAPMSGRRRFDRYSIQAERLSPRKLMHLMESADQIGVTRLDHNRNLPGQPPERSQIGMIHMGVGEEQQVQRRQLPRAQRGLHQTARPELGQPSADPDPTLEGRVGQNPGSQEIDEHRRVAEPSEGELVIAPGIRLRPLGRRSYQGPRSGRHAESYTQTGVFSQAMRIVLQRVSRASVTIDGQTAGAIGPGFCLLVGFTHGDTEAQVDWMAEKVAGLRLFSDQAGKMNLGLSEVGGAVLVISQFTLYGDAAKGRRPSFVDAARPEVAIPLYQRFLEALKRLNLSVASGEFGADMQVEIHNDGPVTLVLDRAP